MPKTSDIDRKADEEKIRADARELEQLEGEASKATRLADQIFGMVELAVSDASLVKDLTSCSEASRAADFRFLRISEQVDKLRENSERLKRERQYGYDVGFSDGRDEGLEVGREAGRKEGRREGVAEGRRLAERDQANTAAQAAENPPTKEAQDA